tara:strand:- start:273 stop:707 length:435 start_codon:yes stop_codon:yes gene_type:complete
MATAKTISGSSIVLGVDLSAGTTATNVAAATSGVLVINQETIDCTNKDSSGRKEFINGVSSWSVDCEAYILGDNTGNSANDIVTALDNGTSIYVQFRDTTGQADSKKYTGRGFVTSVTQNANVGEFCSYSMTIQGTGQLTVAAA